MPHRMFTPRCDHASHADLVNWPECQTCGALHEFAGWFRFSNETMAAYQYAYGLKPVGPHRALANQLLDPSRAWCPECYGSGIHTDDINRWHMCSSCEGTGGHWTCTQEQLEALRRQVLEQFPEAAVTRAPTNLASPGLAQNLQDGTIVDLLEDEEEVDASRVVPTDERSRQYYPPPPDIAIGIPDPRPNSESEPEPTRLRDQAAHWFGIVVGILILAAATLAIGPHDALRVLIGGWAAISALRDTRPRPSVEPGGAARALEP